MKKTLLGICLLTGLQTVKAQTAQETIDWLSSKTLLWVYAGGNNIKSDRWEGDFEFSATQITFTIKNLNEPFSLDWGDLKEIATEGKIITLISYKLYEGKINKYITINIKSVTTNEEKQKYLKALKHIATLNNAKLLKDDLF